MAWRTLTAADVAPRDKALAARWLHEGYWRNETINDCLTRWRNLQPEAIAVSSAHGDLSWAELGARVDRFAAGLRGLGLLPGNVVAVQLPNTIEFVVAYLAIIQCRAVMQTIHMPYRGAELDFLLQHGGARIAIGLSSFKDFAPAAHMLAAARAGRGPEHVIVLGAAVPGAVSFGEIQAGSTEYASSESTSAHAEEPFLLLYTSGTTANPKGVPHAYRSFLANSRLSADALGVSGDDALLSLAPLSHLYGLFVLHLALMTGARQVLLPAFTPPDFAATVQKHKATQVYAAPAHLAATLAAGLMDTHDFSSVRFVCLSGSAVAPLLARQVEAKLPNGKAMQLWGMSELQAGAYTRINDTPEVRHSSAGAASPGTELRVVDSQGQVLPAEVEGTLQVRGPSVFAGYLDNPSASEAAFVEGGWFDTGDTARLSPNGHLTLTGRVTETINRGAVKFNPVDIELLLETHPAIERCVMVPMPDPVLGERACLFAVRRVAAVVQSSPVDPANTNTHTSASTPGIPAVPNLAELCAWLNDRGISKLKWPERLEWIESMPMTPTQKIQRGLLAKRLREAN